MNFWKVFFCVCFVATGFTACSDKDDNQEIVEQSAGGHLVKIASEETQSLESLVANISNVNEKDVLPEDYLQIQLNKTDVMDAASRLYKQFGDDNGTFLGQVEVKTFTLHYTSIDGNGQPIVISGKLTVPMVSGKYVPIEDIILHCHPTALGNSQQGTSPSTFREMVAYSFAVLDPDYIGIGLTNNQPQTYLCHKLIARNCVDMVLAALEHFKQEGIELAEGYGTYVMGYSQGGGNAMAVARHLQETPEGREANKLVNIKKLYCGGGPYNPTGTFQHWLKTDSLSMSLVLPLVVKGAQEGHPDLMNGLSLSSFFSDEYLASGMVQKIDNVELDLTMFLIDLTLDNLRWPDKPASEKTMYELAQGLPWMQFSKILSAASLDATSAQRRALDQCMAMERVDDWVPQIPVEIYTSPRDNVIPVGPNAKAVYDKFKAAGADVTYSEAGDDSNHLTAQVAWVTHVKNLLKEL